MADQFPDFDQLQQSFQEKQEQLRAEQASLAAKTTEINARFDPLWQQLVTHGLAEAHEPASAPSMSREAFRDQLQADIPIMDNLLQQIVDGNEELAAHCLQHIAGIFTKLQQRWDTIITAQTVNKKEFIDINEKKQSYLSRFPTKSALTGLSEQDMQGLLVSFLQLFEEEDRIIQRTEFYLVELNHLLEVKERLLNVSLDIIP